MAKPSAQVLIRLCVLTLPGRHAYATTKTNLPLTLIFYSVLLDVNKKNVVFSLSKPCIFRLPPRQTTIGTKRMQARITFS